MGAERRRSRGSTESKTHKRRGQTQTNTGHKGHTHTRQAPDTLTHVSQADRQTGNRRQPQTTSAKGQERPRNGARPDTLVKLYKPDRPKDALPRHTPSSLSAPEMKASREARAPSLHRVVSQGTKQRQHRGPEAPERLHRQVHKGEAGRHAPVGPLQYMIESYIERRAKRRAGARTGKPNQKRRSQRSQGKKQYKATNTAQKTQRKHTQTHANTQREQSRDKTHDQPRRPTERAT
jgi:hypothetical protein